MSSTYEKIDEGSKFQSINAGIIGYYKLHNERLLCEFFAPTNGGEYIYIDGIAQDGIIILTKIYPRGVGTTTKPNDTLTRTSIQVIPHNPNW